MPIKKEEIGGEAPSEAERQYHEQIIVPLATYDYFRAVTIIHFHKKDTPVFQYMADDLDDAIDLLHSALIQAHELRRQNDEKEGA